MPSTPLPPRYVVCDNPTCVYVGQLRQVHPMRIGIDLFTYPAAYCGCGYHGDLVSGGVEMRLTSPEAVVEVELQANIAVPVPKYGKPVDEHVPGAPLTAEALLALPPGSQFYLGDRLVTIVDRYPSGAHEQVFRINTTVPDDVSIVAG